MDEKLTKVMISYLRENGYVVIKMNADQVKDSEKCGGCGTGDDCMECSCSVCLVQ